MFSSRFIPRSVPFIKKLFYSSSSKFEYSLIIHRNRYYSTSGQQITLETIAINNDESSQNKLQLNDNKVSSSHLIISQEFKNELSNQLNRKKFKSIALQQDEFNKVIMNINNPFELYYFLETYGYLFNHFNLFYFIKKLSWIKNEYKLVDYSMPEKIENAVAKLLIKLSPHFDAELTFRTLKFLKYLNANLNDFSMKALIQIIKFHVNKLTFNEIFTIKDMIENLKLNTAHIDSDVGQYLKTLDKSLTLSVKINQEDDIKLKDIRLILKYYTHELSDYNYASIIR
jgi:hypothetical protein